MNNWQFFTLLLIFSNSKAQTQYSIWEHFKKLSNPGMVLCCSAGDYEYYDSLLNERESIPLRLGKNVYALVSGTGRLYKLQEDSVERYSHFIRIDSTKYTGYNFASATFVYKNNIYNLGGYGLWRKNGQLRKFNFNTHEWHLVRLNKEIPLMIDNNNAGMLWFDANRGKIYLNGYKEQNDALIENKSFNEMWELDIEKGIWNYIGILTDQFIKTPGQTSKNIAVSPWGFIFQPSKENIYMMNLQANKLYRLKDSLTMIPLFHQMYKYNYQFFNDSIFYAFDPSEGRMDSIALSINDFEPTNIAIYSNKNIELYYWLLAFIPIGGVAVYLTRKKNPERKNSQPIFNAPVIPELNQKAIQDQFKLDELELTILKLIIDNSTAKYSTSINEINQALGLSEKNIGIQKKQRSETLQSINSKLEVLLPHIKEAIKKLRSEIDKRSFEYYIDSSDLEILNSFYNNAVNVQKQ